MINTLKKLGFTDNEAIIYKTLISTGPCFVAPLVQKTKKHRQVIYNALEVLEEKRLVTITKQNGKNFYAVTDPERFIEVAQEKIVLAQNLVDDIRLKYKDKEEQVEVFSGSLSYEQAMEDFRKNAAKSKEYKVIRGESSEWFQKVQPIYKTHVKKLQSLHKDGVEPMIIFYEYEKETAKKTVGEYLGNPYQCRIAKDEYRLPHSIWLTGEHVYILTPASDPLVIHIKSEKFAHEHRDFFEKTWQIAKDLKI